MKIDLRLRKTLVLLLLLNLTGFSVLDAQQQRERRVAASPPPQQQQQQQPAPQPAATPAPQPPSDGPQTIDDLRAKIEQVLQRPELAPALAGVKIASLDSGNVLFEQNANKLMRPASNMKLYTVAAALDRLGPSFRFKTSVYAKEKPDSAGRIKGDLTIYGRGDPSFAPRFNNGDYYKGIEALASKVAAAGVKRVDGDLVGDESYFDGPPFGDGWAWDDLTWYYGAEISALSVDDNSLDLNVKPGAKIGAQCVVTTGPVTQMATIVNHTVTTARGSKTDISVYRPLGDNIIEVSGSVPLDGPGYSGSVAISRPAMLFVSMLKSALAQRGVTVAGKVRVKSTQNGNSDPASAAAPVELTSLESPPFSVIAAQTLKPSQNLYTELILRALGKAAGTTGVTSDQPMTAEDRGHNVVRAFLREAGLDTSSLVLRDGSGLSRTDLVTPASTVQLLTYMSNHRFGTYFREAQPLAGVDGTLRNRFKGTPAENNLRAKTGSLSGVTSLSGYVTSAAGERLVFSIMLNNFSEGTVSNRTTLDAIGTLLASFKGRS
jgi:D-alanyl-D-alanine carboxypeptidase/D-alanyl-D-alanine-endopeptidase (penicillin-binding protein 4)